jgi:hypothetical protein
MTPEQLIIAFGFTFLIGNFMCQANTLRLSTDLIARVACSSSGLRR